MKLLGHYILLLSLIISFNANSTILTPRFDDNGVMGVDNNSFIDPRVNYERFMGRVTDKDASGRIFKIKVENNNTKFLKAGDIVYFKVNNHEDKNTCRASIRSVEEFYFTAYVQNIQPCWSQSKYFPRGMQLSFKSKTLSSRVFEASKYREILILRKESFMSQLNDINNFIWTYDQQRIKEAASFDEKINELKRKKRLALDNLVQKKQENLLLQGELLGKLDRLDESLKHYKVERQEYLLDRWNMDHDQGLPLGRRPQRIKEK